MTILWKAHYRGLHYMIRVATERDIEVCFNMAKKMYSKFMERYGIKTVDKDLRQTVSNFIKYKQNLVIERDGKVVGMTAWIVTGHPANQGIKIFQEVLWCCDSPNPFDALALLRAIEKKAEELRVDIIVLANLSEQNDRQLKKIYTNMGYDFMESHFSKRRKLCQ